MVRQWQELFYEERYSQVYLGYDVPDYVKLAEAYGCVGLRAEQPDEVDAVIEKALSIDRPQRRDRLPRGLEGDVLPDGPRGRLERRHHHRARGSASRRPIPAEAPIA